MDSWACHGTTPRCTSFLRSLKSHAERSHGERVEVSTEPVSSSTVSTCRSLLFWYSGQCLHGPLGESRDLFSWCYL